MYLSLNVSFNPHVNEEEIEQNWITMLYLVLFLLSGNASVFKSES
jgi:hypothetical protein